MHKNILSPKLLTAVLVSLIIINCSNSGDDFIGTWTREGSQDKIQIYPDGTFNASFEISFPQNNYVIHSMQNVNGMWRLINHNIAECYFVGVEEATNKTQEIALFYLNMDKDQVVLRQGILPEIKEGHFSRLLISEP
jgi:hypothetical protein